MLEERDANIIFLPHSAKPSCLFYLVNKSPPIIALKIFLLLLPSEHDDIPPLHLRFPCSGGPCSLPAGFQATTSGRWRTIRDYAPARFSHTCRLRRGFSGIVAHSCYPVPGADLAMLPARVDGILCPSCVRFRRRPAGFLVRTAHEPYFRGLKARPGRA